MTERAPKFVCSRIFPPPTSDMKSNSTLPYKISGRSARGLILGPMGEPPEVPAKYRSQILTALLRHSNPWPASFDSLHTFVGNWDEPEFVVKMDPSLMKHLQVMDWLKTPRWAQDGSVILLNFVLGIVALVLTYRLGTLLQLGFLLGLLAPLGATGIGLYALITWQGRIAWKRALNTAKPALEWRAAHADSVRYIGNLPVPEAKQLAQIRSTPGIGHHGVWDCALLLQEKAPLAAFIDQYSKFYTPQITNDDLVETLGAKLAAATSRVKLIEDEIRIKTTHAAAIHAALHIDITDEERAERASRDPYDS